MVKKLIESALFELTHALFADTEHGRDFFQCVLTFVGYDERAVARRPPLMVVTVAMLEVVAALRLPATELVTVQGWG